MMVMVVVVVMMMMMMMMMMIYSTHSNALKNPKRFTIEFSVKQLRSLIFHNVSYVFELLENALSERDGTQQQGH